MTEQPSIAAPRGYHTVNPYITVQDVPALIEFLQRTFDAVVSAQLTTSDGRIGHTEVRIGDSLLMIGAPQVDSIIPTRAQTRPGTFYVYVADVDGAYQRAMRCGANSWEAPTEMFYGDRVAAVVDTNKNIWWIATRKHTLSWKELQVRAEQKWRDGETSV